MNPMRMLILLAVFWAAGSLLLAAESPPASKPTPAATTSNPKTDNKEAAKDGSKPSISEQAEAALKAAAEADGSAAKEPPKTEDKGAVQDDTQAPPSDSPGKGPSPQRFVPSEQVRADFDVSFPIDI